MQIPQPFKIRTFQLTVFLKLPEMNYAESAVENEPS